MSTGKNQPRRFVRMFKPRFVEVVRLGLKRQTVRPVPKRMPAPGDVIDCRYWSGRPYDAPQVRIGDGVITRVRGCRITETDISLAPLDPCGREGRPECCLTNAGLECIGDGHGGCGWHGCEAASVSKACEYQRNARGFCTGYELQEGAEEEVWLCPACGGECAHTPIEELSGFENVPCGCGSVFPDREAFARADGFADWAEMRGWFEAAHGLPFAGVLIEWEPVEAGGKEGA